MPPDPAGKIIGRVLLGYRDYIKKRWGREAVAEVSRVIDLDLEGVADDRWYLHMYNDDIIDWLADTHGQDTCRMAASEMVTSVGIISYVAWIAGIRRVLKQAVKEYRDSIDYGTIETEIGKGQALIHLQGTMANKNTCVGWIGVLEGIMKLSKAKGGVEKVGCEFDGDERCTYLMRWE